MEKSWARAIANANLRHVNVENGDNDSNNWNCWCHNLGDAITYQVLYCFTNNGKYTGGGSYRVATWRRERMPSDVT